MKKILSITGLALAVFSTAYAVNQFSTSSNTYPSTGYNQSMPSENPNAGYNQSNLQTQRNTSTIPQYRSYSNTRSTSTQYQNNPPAGYTQTYPSSEYNSNPEFQTGSYGYQTGYPTQGYVPQYNAPVSYPSGYSPSNAPNQGRGMNQMNPQTTPSQYDVNIRQRTSMSDSNFSDSPNGQYATDDQNTSRTKTFPQDSAATENDRILNGKIRNKLSGWFSSGYNDTIILKTTNGFVIIQGSVEKPEDIQKVSDTIRKIDNVNGVQTKLIVQPKELSTSDRGYKNMNDQTTNQPTFGRNQGATKDPSFPADYAATDSDRQLNRRIRDKLGGWFTSGFNDTITLKTTNGDVTLEGNVDKAEDIARVVNTVRTIDGVSNVTNRLAVAKR